MTSSAILQYLPLLVTATKSQTSMPLQVDVASVISNQLPNICFLLPIKYMIFKFSELFAAKRIKILPKPIKKLPNLYFHCPKTTAPKTLPFPNFCCKTYIKTAQSIYLLPFGRLKNCQIIKNYCPEKHEPFNNPTYTSNKIYQFRLVCELWFQTAKENKEI